MKKGSAKFQFSLRALLVVMTVIAIVTAIITQYPGVIVVAGGLLWAVIESGAIFTLFMSKSKRENAGQSHLKINRKRIAPPRTKHSD